ncbi:hypothetical protein ACWCP8_22740 [Streptomyces sp. NPDC002206]
MADGTFYSDRLGRGKPRVVEEISHATWRGIVALIRQYVGGGSLARAFPAYDCSDDRTGYSTITGIDEQAFVDSLTAHVPDLLSCAMEHMQDDDRFGMAIRSRVDPFLMRDLLGTGWAPDTVTALDVVEFIVRHIEDPAHRSLHAWNGDHYHYSFSDRSRGGIEGKSEFQDAVNLLFSRNGIAFTLGDNLQVQRVAPPETRNMISDFRPETEDPELNDKLTDAMIRFLSRHPAHRRDAVEKLWDGFERLKTLEFGASEDKKTSASELLDRSSSGSAPYRVVLEAEFKTLTDIGNKFGIRHHEHSQAALPSDAAVDYLFVRLASVIAYVLRATGRMATG